MPQTKTPLEVMAALKLRLDQLRIHHAKALEGLTHPDDVMLTWTSNAIEGNTLTHGETAMLIEKGITVGGKSIAEHLAIQDHYEALQLVRRLAHKKAPLGENTIRDLHRIAMLRTRIHDAGDYADVPRRIAGSAVILPPPHKIPALMADFGNGLAIANGPLDAFEGHYRLVTIHPFIDGNGRTARLLMNLILLRDGYTPISIGNAERNEYIKVIEDRQLNEPLGHDVIDHNSRSAYRDFMTKREIISLKNHINFVSELKEK
jgi:Fic family protein